MSDNNPAGNIIQILANLPDFLRKPMLQGRLKEFFAMSEENRRETIAMALAAAPTIDPAKLAVLVKTWLEIISDFEPERRSVLFSVYSQQVLANPESIQRLDFGSLTGIFTSLGDKQKQAITDSLHETIFSMPDRQAILKLIP
ncbi:MAG: hypothetical protein ACRD99_06880, partial [Nitrososphaera sp.]